MKGAELFLPARLSPSSPRPASVRHDPEPPDASSPSPFSRWCRPRRSPRRAAPTLPPPSRALSPALSRAARRKQGRDAAPPNSPSMGHLGPIRCTESTTPSPSTSAPLPFVPQSLRRGSPRAPAAATLGVRGRPRSAPPLTPGVPRTDPRHSPRRTGTLGPASGGREQPPRRTPASTRAPTRRGRGVGRPSRAARSLAPGPPLLPAPHGPARWPLCARGPRAEAGPKWEKEEKKKGPMGRILSPGPSAFPSGQNQSRQAKVYSYPLSYPESSYLPLDTKYPVSFPF